MIESAYLIPAFPLIGFALLTIFGKKFGDPKAGWLGFATTGMSFVWTLVVYLGTLSHVSQGGYRSNTITVFNWITVGSFSVKASFLVDPLSLTMCLFVTGVSSLILLYSIGYMKGDPRYHQFFVYLNLFVFAMIVLVMADNLLLLFLGWEGVGTCSYLLVGFWFERDTAATAAKKAFIVNRVGDVGLLLGILLIFYSLGTLDFFGPNRTGFLDVVNTLPNSTVTAIALLLFVGAVGKSAQLPLYTWLPDAMEGPTPVSALIHAATMVTAGVYLMVRCAPVLDLTSVGANTVAIVGAATALFAATVACAQNDIKRVLAYSTMSQLGYMFLAVGVGAYSFGLFHMVTHAFFKALLFMSAGAVIHSLHGEQDSKNMGALRKLIPVTWVCFGIGWLALCGIPPFAGFWSKDEILLAAYDKNVWLWAIGLGTVFLTAYYMSRLFFLTFYGKARWSSTGKDAMHPHESPNTMLIPMVILAALSVVGGVLDVTVGPFREVMDHWLSPVLGAYGTHFKNATDTKLWLDGASTGLAVLGIVSAWLIARASNPWPSKLEPKVLARSWFVDPLYSFVFERPGLALARWSAFVVDNKMIDGVVNGSAKAIGGTGSRLRKLQNGYVRSYALSITCGTGLILIWAIIRSAR